ncbi:hypothetical protein M2280_002769 [Prescottella agglutinans]|uniref:Protein NO VEIN C-terminal domain-containing protein n=1 Tax=Prescottella agglutinans TaxID=1644129 RepID=A0ABT6MB61_9NOCA|nr:hypothetical protein [Prescottella agglutinans]
MPVPPKPVLRAAVRWLERLPVSGAARSRSIFVTHPDFSDITPTQYDAAYSWLGQTGLLDDLTSQIPLRHRLFEAVVEHSGAPWLPDADMLVRSPDELPEDLLGVAAILELDTVDAHAQVRAAWGKVNTATRAQVGLAGELALVDLLREYEHIRVEHVAAWSDGFGYDISVEGQDFSAHLEVKSTTRRGRLSIYLSRNEYETMLCDPAWSLVAVRLTDDLQPCAVASIPRAWLESQAPSDRSVHGRWESFRADVPAGVAQPGIPALAPYLGDKATTLSREIGWPG